MSYGDRQAGEDHAWMILAGLAVAAGQVLEITSIVRQDRPALTYRICQLRGITRAGLSGLIRCEDVESACPYEIRCQHADVLIEVQRDE